MQIWHRKKRCAYGRQICDDCGTFAVVQTAVIQESAFNQKSGAVQGPNMVPYGEEGHLWYRKDSVRRVRVLVEKMVDHHSQSLHITPTRSSVK